MSEQDQSKKIDELLNALQNSPAFNGEFEKLAATVTEVKDNQTKTLYEMERLSEGQKHNAENLDSIRKALYDPDKGLYTRVTATMEDNKDQEEQISELKEQADKIKEDTTELSSKLDKVSSEQENLQNITGEDHQHLRKTINTRKHLSKALWAFAVAAIAGFARFIWDIVPVIFGS